jgi:hypothetical protein
MDVELLQEDPERLHQTLRLLECHPNQSLTETEQHQKEKALPAQVDTFDQSLYRRLMR